MARHLTVPVANYKMLELLHKVEEIIQERLTVGVDEGLDGHIATLVQLVLDLRGYTFRYGILKHVYLSLASGYDSTDRLRSLAMRIIGRGESYRAWIGERATEVFLILILFLLRRMKWTDANRAMLKAMVRLTGFPFEVGPSFRTSFHPDAIVYTTKLVDNLQRDMRSNLVDYEYTESMQHRTKAYFFFEFVIRDRLIAALENPKPVEQHEIQKLADVILRTLLQTVPGAYTKPSKDYLVHNWVNSLGLIPYCVDEDDDEMRAYRD